MLDTLTKETWEAYLGETFRIDSGGQLLELRLTSVSGYGQRLSAKREAYSLLFHGSIKPCLMQQAHTVRHDDMGQMEIFLVPIGPDNQGMRYEAIFT